MKTWFLFLPLVLFTSVSAQLPEGDDRLLIEEEISEKSAAEMEAQSLRLEQYLRRPMDLNRASYQELEELGLLSVFQIDAWIRYRTRFGVAESWYVFQAVPGWTQAIVERIKPYCKLGGRRQAFNRLFRGSADHFLLSRLSWRSVGVSVSGALGGNTHRLWRYKVQTESGVTAGILMENDAGERLGKKGPDFVSSFLHWKKEDGRLYLLLGDFSVQFGQGLTCWQGMSFGMGSDLVAIKRQGLAVRPYQSVGESRFMRGVAVGAVNTDWSWDVFVSRNPQTATVYKMDDERVGFRQLDASGYHRTLGEVAKKNAVDEYTLGGSLRRVYGWGRAGLNLATRTWSIPKFIPTELPDSIWNRRVSNASVEGSFTRGRLHGFGEWAIDGKGKFATVGGALLVIDRRIDISLHARMIGSGFQSVDGDALQRSTSGAGEKGFYAQLRFRINDRNSLDVYTDRYLIQEFPTSWPTQFMGSVQGWRWQFQPDKKNMIYVRFQSVQREQEGYADGIMRGVQSRNQYNIRLHGQFFISESSRVQIRLENVFFSHGNSWPKKGFLTYLEWGYGSAATSFRADLRLMWVSTDGWDARVYAYERDVMYKVGFPAFSGTKWRGYANFSIPAGKKTMIWIRIAIDKLIELQAVTENDNPIRSELTFQIRYQWARDAR